MSKCKSRLKKSQKRVQNGLKLKSGIGTQKYFWSAKQHFQSAEWHTFGPQLEDIGIMLKHILFYFFRDKDASQFVFWSSKLFFEPSSLYK